MHTTKEEATDAVAGRWLTWPPGQIDHLGRPQRGLSRVPQRDAFKSRFEARLQLPTQLIVVLSYFQRNRDRVEVDPVVRAERHDAKRLGLPAGLF